LGAILRWAVNWQLDGFDIQLAGLIVFLVGILGLVLSLVLWYARRNRALRTYQTTTQQYQPDDNLPPQP
jgi:hypothetical protein